MAVSSSEVVRLQVTGDDSTVAFSTGIVAATTAELGVWITDTNGTTTQQASGVDYTFSQASGLAVVTFDTAPASTDTITFQRQSLVSQTLDLTFNDRLPSIQIEAALDRIVRMVRDVDQKTVLAFPADEPTGNTITLSSAADRVGTVLFFNETTGELEELTLADLKTKLDAL